MLHQMGREAFTWGEDHVCCDLGRTVVNISVLAMVCYDHIDSK